MIVEPIGYAIVSLFALGMAIAFLTADPRSPTSRALSLFFGSLGLTFLMNIPATGLLFGESPLFWQRVFSVIEIGIMVSALEWILRIGRTQVGARPEARRGKALLRAAQASSCLYGLIGALFPALRAEVWNVAWSPALLARPEHYLFAVPFFGVFALALVPAVKLVRGDIDPAERIRLNALGLAVPFWGAGIFLPRGAEVVSFAIGEVIFLIGAIRYHVLQGQRGQFLARFLSPQLAKLVRERGLASTMQRSRVEISVVACDLRGFTSFAETAAPEEVMKLLDDYYGAVGEAVTDLGGSIKDFAGDGILALVGAPIGLPDHAERAVRMALEIRRRVGAILSRWKDLGLELGLGIGVASGFATVGTIGGSGRLEYAAVGPVVNLASRLCGRAEAEQILADQRTVGLAGADRAARFEKLETAELKGFARPVAIFTVAPAAGVEKGGAAPVLTSSALI